MIYQKTIWTVNFKRLQEVEFHSIKGALSSLRQFLETESPLEIKKKAFYFTLRALFVLKIFKFLSWIFGHIEKRIDKTDKVNFKTGDIPNWLTNNCKTHIDQHGSTNCAHGDERARNVHVKRFSRAQNYVHVNHSKHF